MSETNIVAAQTSHEMSNPGLVFNSVAERNAWLETRLNPDGTLPSVSLDRTEKGGHLVKVLDEQAEERVVGECTLVNVDLSSGAVPYIDWVEVEPNKGYGMATYLEVMKKLALHQGLRSAPRLSQDAYKMWRKLETRGVAFCETPGVEPRWESVTGGGEAENVRFSTVFGEHNEQVLGQLVEEAKTPEYKMQLAKIQAQQKTRLGRLLGRLGSRLSH